MVAFYYPLNDWSLQGMEVGLLTLVISSAILLALRSSRATSSLNLLYLLLGAATLIRMDAAVVCVFLCLCLAWKETEHRRRHLLVGFGWLALFLALQTLARWLYFGELLPNTYYLKMVGYPAAGRIARGLEVAGQLLLRMNPLLVIATLIVVWNERRKELQLLSSVILGQVAYSIYVGGDAWEATQGANRYISIAMPLFFVLFSHSVFTLASHLKKDQWKRVALTAVLPLSLLAFNWRTGPDSVREWLLLRPPEHVADNEHWVRTALQLKEITSPDATIAIVWAGAIPYFSERNCVDMWGKNDKWIARLPMRRLDTGFYPGHMKWDYTYSIGKLQPDVIAQIWMNREEAFPFVQAHYVPLDADGLSVSLRKDSRKILWEKVRELVQARNAEPGIQN